MNGAETLLATAAAAGVDVCFANPGTTELALVAALDATRAIRPVLGLFEGVCTGAADGYARMAGKPALTLLHLGPGLGNGLANLHNARRARAPIVNVVGEHATWHGNADPPLAADIEALARTVSVWVRTVRSPNEIARDIADAIDAAVMRLGVATLILPADCQEGAVTVQPAPRPRRYRAHPSQDAVVAAAKGLRQAGERGALLLGNAALSPGGLQAASHIRLATGCRVLCSRVPARIERGGGLFEPERLAYFPEPLSAQLGEVDALVLAGADEPVAFFGYPGQPSRFTRLGQTVEMLTAYDEDVETALEALLTELGQAGRPAMGGEVLPEPGQKKMPAPLPRGPLTPDAVAHILGELLPEGAIVVDESVTLNRGGFIVPAGAARHSYLSVTGGAIGQGPPCATGAAVACPDRPVIAVQADGSAMYTVQALWTQAREALNVTTLLNANGSYNILRGELRRAGVEDLGEAATALTGLTEPDIDWVSLARSLGVPGVRAGTGEELDEQLRGALDEPGPHLIQMQIG